VESENSFNISGIEVDDTLGGWRWRVVMVTSTGAETIIEQDSDVRHENQPAAVVAGSRWVGDNKLELTKKL
jgi:hypothetical protein